MNKCIVCESGLIESFYTSDKKKHWKCNTCAAKFLDTIHYVDEETEKGRYLEHKNIIDDPGYRKFLSKLSDPLKDKLPPNSKGLDFGCGHGPALEDMLKSDGFEVDLYDPFFFPNQDIFTKQYDFITCTETVEHFFNPCEEFKTLDKLLLPGGWLGVMTDFITTEDAFDRWYYRRDPTHVVFYSEKTFEVIADQRGWNCEIPSKNIVLFNK